MLMDRINHIWVVEWCSTGEQRGQFNVTTLDDVVRTNTQVFSGTRAAKYNERWIIVGAFYTAEKAQEWVEILRVIQEKDVLGNAQPDDRLVPQPVTNAMDVVLLKAMPYQDYLKTDYWQRVRKEVLRRANYRCQVCNASTLLEVHHRTYENRGQEREADVIALCGDCHSKFHGKDR